jgi:AcrR family transcriptional regulator
VTTPKTDRRVQRTHRALREALIELILERGWDGASVQDVCERADVGRSTFYTHFADKEELLLGGFDSLREFLRSRAPAPPHAPPLGFVLGMAEHVHEQRRLFRAVVGQRGGQAVQRRFHQFLLDLIKEDLTSLAPAGAQREAASHYLSGAFSELLIWWLDSKSTLEPKDVAELFHRMTAPVLDVLRKAR